MYFTMKQMHFEHIVPLKDGSSKYDANVCRELMYDLYQAFVYMDSSSIFVIKNRNFKFPWNFGSD